MRGVFYMENKKDNRLTAEERIEKAARNAYDESMSGKVENQNQHHNARKEGFARKEMNRNN